jgi:hypothetical protein
MNINLVLRREYIFFTLVKELFIESLRLGSRQRILLSAKNFTLSETSVSCSDPKLAYNRTRLSLLWQAPLPAGL